MRGWRMNRQNTPGWSLMTPQEREAHYSTMRAMKTYDECRAYMEQHHAQLAERAKAKGATLPLRPRRDPCERLKR
jgi:phage tail tape-measure protein